jgi:RHH-type transcriptional regulator, rel operon repressor / antitoxin RelB
MLAVRLPEELEARLNKVAKECGRSKSWLAREAIANRIADWEDLAIAEKRYADILAGRSKTYTVEEVERELGLAD